MPDIVNLATRIEKQLPLQLVEFMESAALIAANMGWHLYLVGGTVRDLLLDRPNYDLDMVVEGDAIALGKRLAEITHGKITTHSRFGTAKLKWEQWTIDIATARSETYSQPGALPAARPGLLASDLSRRDFTINAMAVELISGHWGQLIDLHGGQQDLKHKRIRILHHKSFSDDATRIWRAIRYEQRLDFSIEPATLNLLKRDVPRLDTISGDRIRHEVELVLKEAAPEKVLCRAGDLGILAKLSPRLKGNGWLSVKLPAARQFTAPESPSPALYLALMVYPLPARAMDELISYLHIPGQAAQAMRDCRSLKTKLKLLTAPKINHSRIYHLLRGYSATAIEANLLASDAPTVRQRLRLFLTKLRYVKPVTSGDDLQKLGVPPGPGVKIIFEKLLEAKLDGKVSSKKAERKLVMGEIS